MSKEVVEAYIKAINDHNVNRLIQLMDSDYRFIDTWNETEDREAMKVGWAEYFKLFPDYHIEVQDLLFDKDIFTVFGYASGTYKNTNNHWRLPAAWKVIVKDHKILHWQVYCDAKVPLDCMKEEDKRTFIYNEKNND